MGNKDKIIVSPKFIYIVYIYRLELGMQEVLIVSKIENLFDTVPRKTKKEEARIKNFFLRA